MTRIWISYNQDWLASFGFTSKSYHKLLIRTQRRNKKRTHHGGRMVKCCLGKISPYLNMMGNEFFDIDFDDLDLVEW